jgi:periplasmic protein TonB
MATLDVEPPPNIDPAPSAPVPNFLLPKDTFEPSLFKSLKENFNDLFFPKKQPPLVLTSKPIPVKDIWGFYDNKKNGALGSTITHIILFAVIVGATLWARRIVKGPPTSVVTTLIAPDEAPILKPSKTVAGGGGGGGDRDPLQASKGKLPKAAMEQITPPAVVVRNPNPKLAVEPTVVLPPQIKLAMSNLPNLGDPMSKLPSGPPSNGTGSGSGIGSGSGGGVGVGNGPGVGEGHGGGIGGGIFRVGGGVSAPRPTYQPDPEYSEEARKAKYQGTSVLSLIVGADGRPRDIHIARSLGLGLDEKAIEAVRQWKFDPAMRDGKPVAVEISVEIDFQLY